MDLSHAFITNEDTVCESEFNLEINAIQYVKCLEMEKTQIEVAMEDYKDKSVEYFSQMQNKKTNIYFFTKHFEMFEQQYNGKMRPNQRIIMNKYMSKQKRFIWTKTNFIK